MKFNILNIESYSEKSNKLTLGFTDDVQGIPSGFKFHIWTPKSVKLETGVNEIPFWISRGIWENYGEIICKNIGSYAYNHAARGNKNAAKDLAIQAFLNAKELNVETPESCPEVGSYVGNTGDKLIEEFKVVDLISTKNYRSDRWTHADGYWRHPYVTRCIWKLEDRNGNIYMCSIASDALNEKLNDLKESGNFVVIHSIISDHSEFRGVKQTWIAFSVRDVKE